MDHFWAKYLPDSPSSIINGQDWILNNASQLINKRARNSDRFKDYASQWEYRLNKEEGNDPFDDIDLDD